MIRKIGAVFIILNCFLGDINSQIRTVSNRYTGCTPDSFRFYTVGNTASGHQWTSSNGSTSSLDSPIFVFSNPGTYAINVNGLNLSITIHPQLNYGFTSDSTLYGCFPYRFNLRDTTYYPPGIFPDTVQWLYQNGGSKIWTSSLGGIPRIDDQITDYYLFNCYVFMSVKTTVPSCYGDTLQNNYFKILDIPKADIQLSSDTVCHLPHFLNITNNSRDSLRTNLNYLWKWNLPAPGGSSTANVPSLVYTQEGSATITLEVVNQFGCKGYDTVKLLIDTVELDIQTPDRICVVNYDTIVIQDWNPSKYFYYFTSEKRTVNNNDVIFELHSSLVNGILDDTFLFKGYHGDFPDKDTFGWITITKVKKSDTFCKTTQKKYINICQTYPKFKIIEDAKCNPNFRDTVRVLNWSPCWDSIIFEVEYIDKYGIRITKDSFNTLLPDKIVQFYPDTNLIYGLNLLNKTDSFYRRGPLIFNVAIAFKNSTKNCISIVAGSYTKSSLFRPHLVNYHNKRCVGKSDSFQIYHYGLGSIDSIRWFFGDGNIVSTIMQNHISHNYTASGNYPVHCIVYSSEGCIDTTNTVYVYRGDSILPQLNISKKTLCLSDTTTLSIANPSNFDKWYFISDEYKNFNCPNTTNYVWHNFYHTGKQYVYLIAEKNGCITRAKDSIYISGPKFNLDYDFKCSRRDSILFFLTDTLDLAIGNFQWDFGDGTTSSLNTDKIWHKFSGDSVDRIVKLTVLHPNGCYAKDSTVLKIRHVKAVIKDSIFCKRSPNNLFLNGRPYQFDPSACRNADAINNYNYSWYLESTKIPPYKYPPYTYGSTVNVDIPLDTMFLTLIARDINGCEDTAKKKIYRTKSPTNFVFDTLKNCPPQETIFFTNTSNSVFRYTDTLWDIYKYKNGIPFKIGSSKSFHDTFVFDNSVADSFLVTLTMQDEQFCSEPLTKWYIFQIDTSHLIVPDSICENSRNQIYSTETNYTKYQYRWYVNNVLLDTLKDSFSYLNYNFPNLGIHTIALRKTRRINGCTKLFIDTTEVKPSPRLRIDNSFDLAGNKCFPAITVLNYTDSASLPLLYFQYWFKGSPRSLNPTTLNLSQGVNSIDAIFWTAYGCRDTFHIQDTVYSPRASLSMDKKAICKGDRIRFYLENKIDVDSVLWSFGDGDAYFDTLSSIYHTYSTANVLSDTIPISFIIYAPQKVCPYSKVDTIFVYEAKAGHYLNHHTDTAYCLAPVTINNTAAKADYYQWDFGDGQFDTTKNSSFQYSYKKPGTYHITQYAYRSPLGCVDTSFSTIILYPSPKITGKVDSVCLGKTVDIFYSDTMKNTLVYLYYDSIVKGPISSSPIRTKINETTVFKLLSESAHGCKDSIEIESIVIKPIEERSWDTIVEMGKHIYLPVGYHSNWTYTWSPPLLNPSCHHCANPELQIFDSVVYHLTIEDYRKCFLKNYEYIIRLYPDILVRVPMAFSPNGDGINDIIYARGFGIKKLLSFKIYNRQGQLLFMTDNENVGWDGYYKGVLQNTDPYYYTFEAESYIPNKIITGEGNFMLLR